MSDGTYEYAMQQAQLVAELLVMNLDQFEFVLQTVDHAHSVAPILDPTRYRNGMGNLDDASALVAPLRTAALKLKPVLEEFRKRAVQQAMEQAVGS